jgi:hypothetical protein
MAANSHLICCELGRVNKQIAQLKYRILKATNKDDFVEKYRAHNTLRALERTRDRLKKMYTLGVTTQIARERLNNNVDADSMPLKSVSEAMPPQPQTQQLPARCPVM